MGKPYQHAAAIIRAAGTGYFGFLGVIKTFQGVKANDPGFAPRTVGRGETLFSDFPFGQQGNADGAYFP
jgi:hypothetical protein